MTDDALINNIYIGTAHEYMGNDLDTEKGDWLAVYPPPSYRGIFQMWAESQDRRKVQHVRKHGFWIVDPSLRYLLNARIIELGWISNQGKPPALGGGRSLGDSQQIPTGLPHLDGLFSKGVSANFADSFVSSSSSTIPECETYYKSLSDFELACHALGIREDAPEPVAKAAYKAQMRSEHSDGKNKALTSGRIDDETHMKAVRINNAWEVIREHRGWTK